MAVLMVQDLAKYWGVDLLFKDINLLLNAGEKMALVGRNGTGKTTLLQVLMGRMEYDQGSITMPAGTRIGYLRQDAEFTPGRTVMEEARSAFAHLLRWEQELRELEAKMGSTADEVQLQLLMNQYADITARFEAAGGYDAQVRVTTVLYGLGYTEEDLKKPVEVLSGGQKVRLGLAKLLLEEPDLLLLDEPTNHLDLAAVEWLEGYFKSLKSAAILVSHDRYFLDKVITRVYELENNTGDIYHGNYSYYLDEKERRADALWTQYERQQAEYAKLEAFYLKWRMTPSRKDQAQSRKKQMDKMELMDKPRTRFKRMKLRWHISNESGEDVLKAENLAKAYGPKQLFRGVNLEVFKGEKVALVGANGCGKSTLLKILQGTVAQDAGAFRWGTGVKRGDFSQDLDGLEPSRTCMEEMLELPGFTKFDAHSLLGRFLFSGEDVDKRIATCSGGERNRLILAKLTVAGANVLLLDEPTNHLDVESKEVLEESLADFKGTLLFVSHDRFFIDQVATKVWEFGPEGVTPYAGNYSAYRAERERLAAMAAQRAEAVRDTTAAAKPAEPVRSAPGRDGRTRRDEKKAAEALARLEQEIQRLEAEKAGLEEQLSDQEVYKSERGRELVQSYTSLQEQLTRLYAEWEQIAS